MRTKLPEWPDFLRRERGVSFEPPYGKCACTLSAGDAVGCGLGKKRDVSLPVALPRRPEGPLDGPLKKSALYKTPASHQNGKMSLKAPLRSLPTVRENQSQFLLSILLPAEILLQGGHGGGTGVCFAGQKGGDLSCGCRDLADQNSIHKPKLRSPCAGAIQGGLHFL